MNPHAERTRPVAVIALPEPQGALLRELGQRYVSARVALDPSDLITPESLANNFVARRLIKQAKDLGGRLHLIGLLSDGGVQSSFDHLLALIQIAHQARVKVVVHALLDGVDVPAKTALAYVAQLEAALDGGVGRIGTVSGRAWGMGAEGRWDRIEKVCAAITATDTDRFESPQRGIDEACCFGNPETFVKPFVVSDYPGVSLVDTALCFNFGFDAVSELARALAAPGFTRGARKGGKGAFEGRFATMVPVAGCAQLPSLYARAPDPTSLPLDVLVEAGRSVSCHGEGGALAIATAASASLGEGRYDFVLADFADPRNAELRAAAVLEQAVQRVIESVMAREGIALVLGARDGKNTSNVVLVDPSRSAAIRDGARCVDLGPALLELMQLPPSEEVEGQSLLVAGG